VQPELYRDIVIATEPWMMLPIERNDKGRPEIHHTRIYRKMRRWQADGSIDRIFAGTVHKLHQDQILDLSVIHGDDGSEERRRQHRV